MVINNIKKKSQPCHFVNPVSAFPAACGGVSEHHWDNLWIDDSSRLAARRIKSSQDSWWNQAEDCVLPNGWKLTS